MCWLDLSCFQKEKKIYENNKVVKYVDDKQNEVVNVWKKKKKVKVLDLRFSYLNALIDLLQILLTLCLENGEDIITCVLICNKID